MNNFFKFLIPQLLEYFNNNEAALAEFISKVIEEKYKNELENLVTIKNEKTEWK